MLASSLFQLHLIRQKSGQSSHPCAHEALLISVPTWLCIRESPAQKLGQSLLSGFLPRVQHCKGVFCAGVHQ